MPVQKLKEFLNGQGIRYITIGHSMAYTAQEIAASAHIPGRKLAKTVIVRIDGKLAMAVLNANSSVDFDLLKKVAKATSVGLATEAEFEGIFPGCEVGAMPPFGNLYGIEVFADEALSQDREIVFNAGTHAELIRLSYSDFLRLAKPTVGKFSSR